MKEQSKRLGEDSIPSLMALSIPAFIGMFVMGMYNIVDTIFVSYGVGVVLRLFPARSVLGNKNKLIKYSIKLFG
ncbi:Undefined function [Listeria monocytogenes N53-1]|nr:Undefined function [Listeria monocytogenes N53-1]